jgi:uncharacterized membrane protein
MTNVWNELENLKLAIGVLTEKYSKGFITEEEMRVKAEYEIGKYLETTK